jgi:hypothetical protein
MIDALPQQNPALSRTTHGFIENLQGEIFTYNKQLTIHEFCKRLLGFGVFRAWPVPAVLDLQI